jgi:hypothetical protein
MTVQAFSARSPETDTREPHQAKRPKRQRHLGALFLKQYAPFAA